MDVWPGLPGHGIGGIGRLGLGKNLVLLLYDFNHFSKMQEEISVFCGCFW